MKPSPAFSPRPLWVWLFATIPLLGWWTYGLFDLDEGFYAAVTAEMNWRGEWIVPYYNGAPWFEKPILLYWLAKPAVAAFGEMVGPRLPSVLATLLLYGGVLFVVRRRLGWPVAAFSVLVMASSLLMVALGRMMMTDTLLVAAFAGAVLLFYESLVGDRRWRYLAAALLGVSVLAKGPVGCAHFVLIVGLLYWREPSLRPAFRGGWLVGTLIFAAVVASWYLPAYLRAGDLFVQDFLIKQNVGRFAGGDAAHTIRGPVNLIFYVVVLLAGMLPWSFLAPAAWPRKASVDDEERPFLTLLGIWFLVVFAFYTVSAAKLPHYILAAVPPLAILVGRWLARHQRANVAWGLTLGWTLAAAVIAQAGFTIYYNQFHRELHEDVRWLRAQDGPVSVYQMPRRQADRGTGGTRLQETSHPSVVFYLGEPADKVEELEDLLSRPVPRWVLTRTGRIDAAERNAAAARDLEFEPIDTGRPSVHYRVYRLRPIQPMVR